MLRASVILPALSLVMVLGGAAGAADEHVVVSGDKVAWQPAPKALPPGAQIAVLSGNPEAKGGFYVIRARFPDGYTVPPHTHPEVENVTVLSGALKFGMGETMANAETVAPGGFFAAPAKMPHHATASGATTIQISGVGPFDITYVNAKDDPRNMVGSSQ